MKRYKQKLLIVITFSLLALTLVYLPLKGTQADDTVYEVDIATSPASGFLIAENLAPGDEQTSILEVQNNGNLDFSYIVSARLEEGMINLYDILLLKIMINQDLLYEGTLRELQNKPLGVISSMYKHQLTFTTNFPLEAGNEMQGQSASVAFDFVAETHYAQNDCFLPPFSNNQFSLQTDSNVPIKFLLRDQNGDIEKVSRNGVRLEITGPAVDGGQVKYVFAISDGTLSFAGRQYLAHFSPRNYAVVTGETYQANVIDGTQLMCGREFVVEDDGNRSNSP
jgi:hypothetical protein